MQFVATGSAPKAIGPYSQATIAGGFLYTAGQIALDPATMVLDDGGVAEQTERVFANLRAILDEAGTGLGSVVKATVYLQDMADFAVMNEIYGGYFSAPAPARATIQAAALPRAVRVEIDCVAYLR
jgi:2-iminobutanoate/2-iminopropanoate deaminase